MGDKKNKKVEKKNSKKKLIIFIFIAFAIVILVILKLLFSGDSNEKSNGKSDEIPDDYIAVFHGGVGEQTYSTYIYKVNNNKINYGFRYINTTSMTVSWGCTQTVEKITSKGNIEWRDEVIKVAEKNGAYSYVEFPNSEKIYSIEEYNDIMLVGQ